MKVKNFFLHLKRKVIRKKILPLALLVLIILLGFGISFDGIFTVSEKALFWTFSTVVQAFLALIAFGGIMAVYRLQLEDKELNDLLKASRGLVRYFKGDIVDSYSDVEIGKACMGIAKEKEKDHPGSKTELRLIKNLAENLEATETFRAVIKDQTLKFSRPTLFVVFISLLFLPFTFQIIKFHLDLSCLLIVLIFSFYSLRAVKGFIWEALISG